MSKKTYKVISIFLVILGLINMSLIFVEGGDFVFAIIGGAFFISGWIGYILSKDKEL